MNALAKARPVGLPQGPIVLGAMSGELATYAEPARFPSADGSPDLVIERRGPSLTMRVEARRVVADADRNAAPATYELIRRWVLPLAAAVRNPLHPEAVDARIGMIGLACAKLPGWAFNDETQAQASREFRFWPAAGDVHELLEAHASPILRRLDALRRIAAYEDSPAGGGEAPAPAQTAEDRQREAEAVRRSAERFRKDMAGGRDAPGPRPAGRSKWPPPDTLQAMRDASPVIQAARKALAERAA